MLLQNRIYVGDMMHKGKAYPGLHDPIIERELFDRVQAQLESARVQRRNGSNAREPSLLAGLLRDGHGRMMSPTHAVKQQRRYRYYVSQTDDARGAPKVHPAWRVGAIEIERLVCSAVTDEIKQRVHSSCHDGGLESATIARLQDAGTAAVAVLDRATGSEQRALLLSLVRRIDVSARDLAIDLKLDPLDPLLATNDSAVVYQPLLPTLVRIGKQARLLLPAEGGSTPADANLVKLLARAFAVRKAILESESLDSAAAQLGYGRDYAVALARVSYLAPHIIKAILSGAQPAKLGPTPLARTPNLPYRWDQQSAMLGFA